MGEKRASLRRRPDETGWIRSAGHRRRFGHFGGGGAPGLADIVISSRVWMSRARRSSKYAGQSGDAALWGPLHLTLRKGAEQFLE